MSQPSTICELLEQAVLSHHNPKLLNSKFNGHWVSFSADEVYQKVKDIALGLHSLGVQHGDKVALYADSSAYWTISDLGIIHAGASDVPIYVTQSVDQIEFILKNSESRGIFVSNRRLYDRGKDAIKKSSCKFVISLDDDKFDDGVMPISELISLGKQVDEETPELFDQLKRAITPDEPATIIYTSGTTGEPKGVVLSHKNLVSNALSCSSLFTFRPNEEVALSYLPPSHVFERMILYLYIHVSAQIYYAESIDALQSNLLEVKPHMMTTVPRMLEKVFEKIQNVVESLPFYKRAVFKWAVALALKFDNERKMPIVYRIKHWIASVLVYKQLRHAFGNRIKFIISGGAALRPDLARIFCAAGLTTLQGYGLTETSPVISVNRLNRNRIGSVGPAIPGVAVKIAEDGEILVDGPNVMLGYYKNPEATSAAFQNCWFKTGDIGYLDNDGFLFITDRKKDLIKTSGGKYIAPQEIEMLLSKNLYIDKAIVIGDQRKFASALLFPNFEALTSYAEKNGIPHESRQQLVSDPRIYKLFESIVAETNTHLSHWETIKKFAIIDGELTIEADYLTPTLKMKRRNVENRYRDIIESFYKD